LAPLQIIKTLFFLNRKKKKKKEGRVTPVTSFWKIVFEHDHIALYLSIEELMPEGFR
jgi:hypothetical protein